MDRGPLYQFAGRDHLVELGVAHEVVVLPGALPLSPSAGSGRDREHHLVGAALHQRVRQRRLTSAARGGDHQGEGASAQRHSTFSTCSRSRSISFLIATTWCWIPTSFAFEPIVF